MNLTCPGCRTAYPLPGHVQQNHPFNCPSCRYSGTVGAILAASPPAQPAAAPGGFAMPGPPVQDPGFAMPGPPVQDPGFAMPGPPVQAEPVQVTPVQLINPGQAAPVHVTPVQVTPAADSPLELSDEVPSMEWAEQPTAPRPQRPPPASGGLDLMELDEPEEPEEVPAEEDEGFYEGEDEELYEDPEPPPELSDKLKKIAPGIVAVVVILLVAINFMSSGDEKKGPTRKQQVATAEDSGEEQPEGEQPAEPAKPDLLAEPRKQAEALRQKEDYLGALAVYDALPADVKEANKEAYAKLVLTLGGEAADYASGLALPHYRGGKVKKALGILDTYLKKLQGEPRQRLLALRAKLGGNTAAPEPAADPKPAPKPAPVEPKPAPVQPRPAPVKAVPRPAVQPRPPRAPAWIPKPAGTDKELLQHLPTARISRTKHYVVVSTADAKFTKTASSLLESVRRGFYRFFQKKGFEPREHPGRLVAYVFGDRSHYEAYLGKAGLSVSGLAAGFYHTGTNALYFVDSRNTPNARRVKESIKRFEDSLKEMRKKRDQAKSSTAIRSWNKHIMKEAKRLRTFKKKNKKFLNKANHELTIHEATHQLCYNAAILTPSDINPEWVVEGLAMLFEETAVWQGKAGRGNQRRIRDLKRLAKQGQRMTVRQLVGSNQSLISRGNAGLAYGSAWALIHMFVRGKFKKYKLKFIKYLQGVQRRSKEAGWRVRGGAAAAVRLEQFEDAFGRVDDLEPEYKAYIDKLIK